MSDFGKDINVPNNDLISRQAAIAVADSSDYVGLSVEDVKKVTDEVVKGLKQLPSAKPESIEQIRWERDVAIQQLSDLGYGLGEKPRTDGDTISRQAAIDALEEQLDYLQMLNKDENPRAESKWYGVNWARNTIAELPSAQPERKKGKWLQTVKHYKDDEQEYNYIETTCSVCGVKKRIGWIGVNYCPNCGADMRGEQE